ncbi:MAG: hypothetical protein BAA01_04165 [Bacillus thermozeamaize]|uniref:SLH domain-containing protein n=1 Tax=Bacillus thermozeamaize TaxID=230954 RepID=A0A1Y3PZW9_9BACI|nr:MAG: hypothetical protein BAA01_04165 [Bacillus thermozeamaize]
MQGYNGFYYPDRPITRAEFAAFINRSFNLTEAAKINFIDLKDTHWAYPHIAIAVQANYIQGYSDHTVQPDQKITREEAAVMVYKLLKIENGTQNATIPFKDHAAISDWSKEAVLALSQNSIIKGRGNGNFDPQGHLTRAEAVTLLESALNYAASQVMVYDTPGQYGPDTGVAVIKGSVIVASPGVTLRNVIIEGDLTVAETVGDGDAYFKNVSVRGTTYIYGGGPESVHFEDSVLVWIWVDERDGIVRVVASGNTVVEYVEVHSPVKLEESSLTNSGFANVEISEGLPVSTPEFI